MVIVITVSKMAASREGNQKALNFVDDFESAFQNCISLLTSQTHFNVQDTEETKGGVENSVQRFLESGRQMDSFFLTKRLALSVAKPEHVLNEDIAELKTELDKKEKLIEKHHDKLQKWQALLRSNQQVIPPAGPYQSGPPTHPANMIQQQPGPTATQQGPPPPPPPMPPVGGAMMASQQPSQQAMAAQGQGQYPGPPASHPGGQFIMPPPAYPQGPLAYLERM